MGVKKLNIYQLVTNASMASNILSTTQNVQNFDNIGLQFEYSGTPTGTFAVLGSVDNTNFYPLTFNPTLQTPTGSSGGFLLNLNQFPWPFLQVSYTASSGTGVLNVFICSKDLN